MLNAAGAANASPDYLSTEIRHRVQQMPVKFKMVLQVAESGDKLDDPSIAWPDGRRVVELGTLSIARAMSADAEKTLLFMPNALTAGIEVEDPMINVRSAAYPVSFERRQQ